MNQHDLDQFFDSLKQHYPNTTTGDLEMVGEAMKGLSYEQAMAALRSIRMSEKTAYRPSVPKFADRAKTMKDAARPAGRKIHQEILWFIRNRSDSRDLVKTVEDVHAIEVHFKRSWEAVQAGCHDEVAINSGRRMVYGHCRMACLELGWSDAEAREFAGQVVDLKPGENIPKPTNVFQDMPKPAAVTPFSAIKALAVAEHTQTDAQLVEANAEAPK